MSGIQVLLLLFGLWVFFGVMGFVKFLFNKIGCIWSVAICVAITAIVLFLVFF
jgi:hypothetical protein